MPLPKKSKIERVLTRLKKIIAAVSRTNPAAKALNNMARNELISNEAGMHVTPGLGQILADKYFPLEFNPANSFYANSIDPRSIQQIRSS